MKSLVITIVAVALLALLAYTNPNMDSYQQYVHQRMVQAASNRDDVNKAVGVLFAGIASALLTKATYRSDYVFWSVYTTDFGSDQSKIIGVLNNFIVLKSPQALQNNGEKSSEKSGALLQTPAADRLATRGSYSIFTPALRMTSPQRW